MTLPTYKCIFCNSELSPQYLGAPIVKAYTLHCDKCGPYDSVYERYGLTIDSITGFIYQIRIFFKDSGVGLWNFYNYFNYTASSIYTINERGFWCCSGDFPLIDINPATIKKDLETLLLFL